MYFLLLQIRYDTLFECNTARLMFSSHWYSNLSYMLCLILGIAWNIYIFPWFSLLPYLNWTSQTRMPLLRTVLVWSNSSMHNRSQHTHAIISKYCSRLCLACFFTIQPCSKCQTICSASAKIFYFTPKTLSWTEQHDTRSCSISLALYLPS